jgi:predicted O-methyltransferase YrrM
MSTFGKLGDKGIAYHHRDFIREIVKQTGCQVYLELGTYDGHTFNHVLPIVKRGICVDVVDKRLKKLAGSEFHLMTTDVFFTQFHDPVDVVFIDADHCYESARKDFENSLKLLNQFGIIIMHDSDPITREYSSPGYCGDSYRMVDYITETHPELNIMTLPFTCTGISIINRKSDRRVLKW